MDLNSTVFQDGNAILGKYTCDGKDMSPPLSWRDAPENAKSYAMVVDDPDAPNKTWVHWVIYNIPGDHTNLSPGFPAEKELSDGTLQGINDFDNIGYGGPCPPQGHGRHRYFFKLYALDKKLDLAPGADKETLEDAMVGHILAESQLVGTYEK